MPFKIVRNDIVKMNTEAIVNTANSNPSVGAGCDSAVYKAAGHDKLLSYRQEKIGSVPEGDAFITPGFDLPVKYIIHAVSPMYMGGDNGEEEKLRSCYRKSLELAKENNIKSIAFPLIATGGYGYPKEEGMRIAVDEINAFLLNNEMDIYLAVFDTVSTELGEKLYPDLEAYIDRNYVDVARDEEYGVNSIVRRRCLRMTRKNNEVSIRSGAAEYLTYVASTGGNTETFDILYSDENIWITQKMMASLYGVSKSTISEHISKVFEDSELDEASTVRKFRTVQIEGGVEKGSKEGHSQSCRVLC